ncbi:MAG: hypothetical protein AB7O97_18855 [Planctomycetota bacterium]
MLTVQNLAPLARREVVAVAVPFARGAVPETPDLHVDGVATGWQPFGARWPDGSVRQALCLFACTVPALGEVAVPLVPGPGPAPPDDAAAFAPLAAALTVVARTDRGEFRGELPAPARLEDNTMRRVDRRAGRLGATGLVVELQLAQGRGDRFAYVDVAAFHSDPGVEAMQLTVHELSIETAGMALLLRHPGLLAVTQATRRNGSRVVLLREQVLGDGQGIRRCGALVPPHPDAAALAQLDDADRAAAALADSSARAAVLGPVLGATDWSGTGAFGPFGEPAPLPPWLQGPALRQALARRHAAFVAGERQAARAAGDPFAVFGFGQAKNAGQTGDQYDFGVVKLSVVARSGVPSHLLEVEPSVLQEACRPVHVFEPDGAMVRAADHPEWIVWSGRTHWHCEVSRDRLGKPCPEPPFETHGWTGRDRQHWSNNHLGAFAQLTGAAWARRELEHEVQLYLSGQTTDPRHTTSGSGAPRGAGRSMLAACWMYLATGDPALLQRMNERIDRIHWAQWAGRELGPDQVRTMAVQGPDARMLMGRTTYWTPWQDALAATGFAAAHRLTGNAHARELAEELAITVVRHGFRVTDSECIVATALAWHDGAPLSPAQEQDPTQALWSYGTGFNEWALGAVEIARIAAIARGDAALRERAETIQRRVRQGRQRPDDGWIDRLSEWDAVRWEPAPP